MTIMPTQNTPSIWDIIAQSLGGQQGTPTAQTMPVRNPQQVPQQVPEGFRYSDPIQEMNFLEKLGMAAGGIDRMNDYRTQAYNRQLSEYKMQQEADQRRALQDIAKRMQTGELDREGALMEYAQRTGDYSKMFQQDTTPAAIKEYQFVAGLSPEEKQLYFQNKRANQMFDRGGSQVVLSPEGVPIAEYGKTLAPEQLPSTQAAQAAAKETAKGQVAKQSRQPKAEAALRTAVENIGSQLTTIGDARKAAVDEWGTTGLIGSIAGFVPGTDAFDLRKNVMTLQANAFVNALAEMRANSPTGGAVGNVTEAEGERLSSLAANLDASQSEEQFLKNLDKYEKEIKKSRARLRDAFVQDFGYAPEYLKDKGSNQNDRSQGGTGGGQVIDFGSLE